jgi:two-component system OmpR family sensor kinase
MQAASLRATTSEGRMRQYLSDTVHELRTPLTVLRGSSQLLLRPGLDHKDVDAALRAINEEATRMARLVDNLIHLTRLDVGQPLDPHPVTLSLFLAKFVQRYASAWPDRTISLDQSDLNGAQAHVDPEALTRVLINLVDNAARYSLVGRPIVITGEAAGSTVSITVQDEGPGLSPEDAARVFERFFRGSVSRSCARSGSGLGLAIVDALVRQSHGDINIDTGPDCGTAFTVTLPRPTSPAA